LLTVLQVSPQPNRFGHAQGDALLCALANHLRRAVRSSDVVCRIGGDEIVVICPRSSLAGALEAGRKILTESRPLSTPEGVECWDGSLSIGVAAAQESMEKPEDLLKAADLAVYESKRSGGGPVSSCPEAILGARKPAFSE
jgi:diguanylate cyclase (GGDEF)-like protein